MSKDKQPQKQPEPRRYQQDGRPIIESAPEHLGAGESFRKSHNAYPKETAINPTIQQDPKPPDTDKK